jgi:hypothetical protein
MGCDNFSDAAGSGRSRIDSASHSRHFATHNCSYQAGIDLLIPNQLHICGFDHRIGRLNHGDQPSAFNHTERFFHDSSSPEVPGKSFWKSCHRWREGYHNFPGVSLIP